MKELMTKELEEVLPKLYATENIKLEEKILQVRYRSINSNWEWYLVEYDKDKKLAFGYIKGFENEWGYFSLKELEEINDECLSIIRDKTFQKIEFIELDNDYYKVKV